jgi:hypothetical protein
MAHYDWTLPVTDLVRHLLNNGFMIHCVDDGGELIEFREPTAGERITATVDTITSVDNSIVMAEIGGRKVNFFILLGNEPDEMVYDYQYAGNSTTLSNYIDETLEKFQKEWEGRPCPMIEEEQ